MSEETNIDTEGCLSVPGYYGKVQRASKIKVRSLTRHGKTVIYEPEGFLAVSSSMKWTICTAIYLLKKRRIYRK